MDIGISHVAGYHRERLAMANLRYPATKTIEIPGEHREPHSKRLKDFFLFLPKIDRLIPIDLGIEYISMIPALLPKDDRDGPINSNGLGTTNQL